MIRLAVRVARADAELVLAELLELVPSGVEEREAGDAIEYVIYGAPGEVPDVGELRAVAGPALVELSTSEVPDDWAERWKAWHRPVDVSWRLRRLRVRPPWEPPLAGAELELVVDPGQAFGTGAHHTTRLCLELLLSLEPAGALADWGCGTGVLAIAAARLGFTPVLASSGPEGLALARERRPLAITLDVIMPEMDGWTVLSELQSDRALADVPVIMLTILSDSQMGYALGASAYLQKPIEAARLTTALQAIGAPRDRSGRVLVVDDDEATRLVLRRHLQSNNWTVSTACNGRVALECLAEARPDIILLDLMMPEMDGFQFLEHLRNDEANCAIPVVVISAKDMDDEERAQLNGHVSRVIDKRGQTSTALLPEVTRLVRAAARPATAA